MEKEEKKQKKILTDNRLMTVNKRETSFEGLVSQLENGEDGIYNLMADSSKDTIFQPKVTITKQDLADIPCLRQLRDDIDAWEKTLKTAEGRDKFIIKKALIEMRKDQYLIKNAYRRPVIPTKLTHSTSWIPLDDLTCEFDEKGYPIPKGFSLLDPKVCEAILCNYSRVKQDSYDHFEGDSYYIIYDFEELCERALRNYPLYHRLLEYKIDGIQNAEIQEKLRLEFGIKHSVEYISSLWRQKIPKIIASTAEDEFLGQYYLTKQKGKYKRCSRCGQIKLAHNKYFSKNKTSRDGFYSICKECRNKKSSLLLDKKN